MDNELGPPVVRVHLGPVGACWDKDQPVIGQPAEFPTCGPHCLGACPVGFVHDDARVGCEPSRHGGGKGLNFYRVANAQRVRVDPALAVILRHQDVGAGCVFEQASFGA